MTLPFIGRKKELAQLNALLQKSTASIVVVRGRRRIGKSRLLAEFSNQFKVYNFSGIPPTEKTTAQDQRNDFGWQLGKLLQQPAFKDNDWNDLLLRLSQATRRGKTLIILDEISWLGAKDPNFLGKLKNAWDLEFKKNPRLILAFCGSVSTWIENNILSSTGFLGRISLDLVVEEMPLADCNQFWLQRATDIAPFEKFKMLAVTGGIPKYLEEIKPNLTAEENIKQLCFQQSGLLFNEFDRIFADVFAKRSNIYKNIVTCIASNHYEYEQIYRKLGSDKSGSISNYLEDLIQSGFISRDHTWHLATTKISKLSRFRIKDNYLRFYLHYILPNQEKIKHGAFTNSNLALLPNWETIMGLQFENLVLNNREKIHQILGIKPEEIIYDNPFFQKKTTRQQGCQIDYLIQTRSDTLYVCEIKFSRQPVGVQVIKAVREKISRLKAPKHISRRACLIHVNGVTDELLEQGYFSQIIDFSSLLHH